LGRCIHSVLPCGQWKIAKKKIGNAEDSEAETRVTRLAKVSPFLSFSFPQKTWDRWYDSWNIFAITLGEHIGIFLEINVLNLQMFS
jgi:hypothetical protein